MFKKFAIATIISAEIATKDAYGLVKAAHRAVFNYTPREGYLYVRSRMISSRCNDNYDDFPPEEILASWKTAIGKPAFVNHHNETHKRMRGVIIDAALHEDTLPDGKPDIWIEALHELDAKRFPKLAKEIIEGRVNRTSMGCDVGFSVCSACGNKATSPAEYCQHIPRMKGQILYRHTASGQREGHLIREICHKLSFFENSFLVEDPADPTAVVTGVDDRGIKSHASSQKQAKPDWFPEQGKNYHGTNCIVCGEKVKYYVKPSQGQHGGAWSHHDSMKRDHPAIPRDPEKVINGIPAADAAYDQASAQMRTQLGLPSKSDRGLPPDPFTAKKMASLRKLAEHWVDCDQGHEHWGPHGAAGMLISHHGDDGETRYLLQKRAPWVDHGNTWGIPGGALEEDESPEEGARRETREEMGKLPTLKHRDIHTDDHGGWAYHTVVADAPHRFTPTENDGESAGHGWFTKDEMKDLDLHPGFAKSVHRVTAALHQGEPFRIVPKGNKVLVVDAAGKTRGEHATEQDAKVHQAALYASLPEAGDVSGVQNPERSKDTATEIVRARMANQKTAGTHPEAACPSCASDDFTQLGSMGICQSCGDTFDASKSMQHNLDDRSFAKMRREDFTNGRANQEELFKNVTDSKTQDALGGHYDVDAPNRAMHERQRQERMRGGPIGLTPKGDKIEQRQRLLLQRSQPYTAPYGPMNNSHLSTLREVMAYGETKAPADVDTLRTESCPVCGETESFDGDRCQVCNFLQPPSMFMDPDTSVAKQMDLKQENFDQGMVGPDGLPLQGVDEQGTPMEGMPGTPDDGIADLFCPACGFSADTQQPMTNNDPSMPSLTPPAAEEIPNEDPNAAEEDPAADPALAENPEAPSGPPEGSQGLVEGDVCPNCGAATMLSPNDIGEMGGEVPQEIAADADADGVPDAEEEDADADGIPDDAEDADQDGVPDDAEPDLDGDSVPDDEEEAPEEEVPPPDAVEDEDAPQKGRKDNSRRAARRGMERETMTKQQPNQAASGAPSEIAVLKRTIAAQQIALETQEQQLHYLANLAGVVKEFNALTVVGAKKIADILNPAQPIPDPPSSGPSETTEQAATPETFDDPRNPGITPGSVNGVPAQMTDSPLNPGVTLPTSPYGNLVDVTQPVAGTETQIPLDQMKIETDVRVGDPMVGAGTPEGTAFPLGGPFAADGASYANTVNGLGMPTGGDAQRTMASLRLARLRKQSGLLQTGQDEFVVAAGIEKDAALSTATIEHEILTLEALAKRSRPSNGRPVRQATAERRTPSLASLATEGAAATGGGTGFADTDASDLFLMLD